LFLWQYNEVSGCEEQSLTECQDARANSGAL
jgi:hypothetical protein